MKPQRTLSIVKPDGVRKGVVGEVIRRFETSGIRVVAMRMLHLTKKEAEGFYAVHRERPFFGSLTEFMSSGPIVVMVLEGENVIARNRSLMGATDPKKADRGTIRADLADNVEQNIVHGSDAPETAATEISYFFSKLDISKLNRRGRVKSDPASRTNGGDMTTGTTKIIWTKIDEAPALATYSLLPIVQAFTKGPAFPSKRGISLLRAGSSRISPNT